MVVMNRLIAQSFLSVFSFCGTVFAQADRVAAPKPYTTIDLRSVGIAEPKSISDKQLGIAMSKYGELSLTGFDPNLHLAYVDESCAILYREEQAGRLGSAFELRVYKLSLSDNKMQQIAVPYANITDQSSELGNTEVQVVGRTLVIRANTRITTWRIADLTRYAEFTAPGEQRPSAAWVGYYAVADDAIATCAMSKDGARCVWLSIPELKVTGQIDMPSVEYQGESGIIPAQDYVLRAEVTVVGKEIKNPRIRAYFRDGISKEVCSDTSCLYVTSYIANDTFLVHSQHDFALLHLASRTRAAQISGRHELIAGCEYSYLDQDVDRSSATIGLEVDCTESKPRKRLNVYRWSDGTQIASMKLDVHLDWYESKIGGAGTILGVLTGERLRLYRLPPEVSQEHEFASE